MLLNKDRITAGDGARAHDLEGKAEISNQTNAKVFNILNKAGMYFYGTLQQHIHVKLFIIKFALSTCWFIQYCCCCVFVSWPWPYSVSIIFFYILGVRTAFVKIASDKAFIAKKCAMVPIEWVTRRMATGSFLKRHPGIIEGLRFAPPKQETFFKDDENHDPQWNEEQILAAQFNVNGLIIGKKKIYIYIILRTKQTCNCDNAITMFFSMKLR